MKKTSLCLITSSLMAATALAAPTGYQSAVLANNPYIYHRLGESSGTTAADASVNNFAGTYTGSPTLGVPGDGGDTAVTFNGTSQYVINSPAVGFGNYLAHVSFELVFTNNATTGIKSLLGAFNTGTTEAFNIELNATAAGSVSSGANLVRLFIRDQSGTGVGATFANAAAFDGNYHHLVYTYDSTAGASRVKAYLDGVSQTITYGSAATGGTPVNFAPLGFGPVVGARNLRGVVGEFFPGKVDEAAFYTNVLSAATVALHYQALLDTGLTNLSWAVGDGTWDINTTANWKNAVTSAADFYVQTNGIGNRVTLDDTASGSSPITITLNTAVSPRSITNNSTKSYTISGGGNFSGFTGLTKAGSGTLTLNTSGASTFTGMVNLNGGILEFAANNLGGSTPPPITFNSGTLRYGSGNVDDVSLNSVAFTGNASIDVGANNVTFATGVGAGGAGGFTKLGSGTLTLAGTNDYAGITVVSNGTLALASGALIRNSAAIIVTSGKILDASASGLSLVTGAGQVLAGVGTVNGTVISSNGVITPGTNGVVGTLTFGNDLTVAGGSVIIDLATNTAQRDLIAVGGNLSLYGGTLQLNVTGTLTNGVYKLIQYSGSLASGANSSANLLLTGYSQAGKVLALSDSINANEIDLVVTSQGGVSITWQGDGSNNYWDIETSFNFTNSIGTPVTFVQGDAPIFNDTSVNPTVNLNASLQPGSVTVTANANNYLFADGTGTGAGKLSGPGGITKNGSSTLTIATANLNSGPTVINGGTVQVGNGGALGDLGSGNVTNNAALVFNQSGSHSVSGSISGTGTVTQQGSGTVILSANNSYSGQTTISSGVLQVGNGGSTGTLGTNIVTDNSSLTFNRNSSLTVSSEIDGTGSLGVNSGNITLAASNSFAGGVSVIGGKLIIGNARAIPAGQNLVVQAGGTNDLNGFDLTVSRLNSSPIFSGGSMVNNSGTGTNVLTIDYDGTSTASSSIAIRDNDGTGGKIMLVKTGVGEQILAGASSYSGGTIISNGTLQVRNSTSLGVGNVVFRGGNVSFNANGPNIVNTFVAETNASFLTAAGSGVNFIGDFITSSNFTFSMTAAEVWNLQGNISQFAGVTGTIYVTGDSGFFRFFGDQNAANATIDMTGFAGTVGAGANVPSPFPTIQIGALIGDSTGSFGNSVAGATYVIGAKNLDTTFSGTVVAAAANFIKVGTGRFTLAGSYGFSRTTTVSNGVLALVEPVSLDSSPTIVLGASTAKVDVSARADGTLNLGNAVAQTLSGIGIINGSLNENANSFVTVGLGILNVTNVATLNGALTMQLNRTNAINASKLTAFSFVNASALTVTNVGPALQGGDTFQLFGTAVTGFTVTNLPTLTGNLYWTNNLAVNGSIAVVSPVNTSPPPIILSFSGGVLSLSWPTNAGWTLQTQTNSLSKGLGTNWVDVPGSTSITSTNITVNPALPTVFYRLKL